MVSAAELRTTAFIGGVESKFLSEKWPLCMGNFFRDTTKVSELMGRYLQTVHKLYSTGEVSE